MLKVPKIKQLVIRAANAPPTPPPPNTRVEVINSFFSGDKEVTESIKH